MARLRSRQAREALNKMRQAWVDKLPKALVAELSKAVNDSADEVAAAMLRIVPIDQGDLRDSIVITRAGENTPAYSQPGGELQVKPLRAVVTAGNSKVRYAHLVEYGTVKARAQPFFWPSWRSRRAAIKRRLAAAFRKAFKRYAIEGSTGLPKLES